MENRRSIKLILVAVLTGFFAIRGVFGFTTYPYEAGNLYVHILDVGQGDAILIHTPQNKKILIDTGPHNNIREPLSDILGFGLHHIDEVYLSHPHSDHISGLLTVIKKYTVGEVWYTGVIHTTPVFRELLQQIRIMHIPLVRVQESGTRIIDGVHFEVLYPDKNIEHKSDWVEGHNGLNDTSIVLRVMFGETSFLLMGDAEEALENYLLGQYATSTVIPAQAGIHSVQNDELIEIPSSPLKADVLKVGHHGSKTSTQKKFLEAVNPTWAVISSGENNYGHPHPSVINRLNKKGVHVLQTNLHGTITFISDGYDIQIDTHN